MSFLLARREHVHLGVVSMGDASSQHSFAQNIDQ